MAGNTIKDQIAFEYNFIERYGIKKNPKTTARNKIDKSLEVDYQMDSDILEIGYKDIDPEFATKVVNRISYLLEQRFKNITLEGVLDISTQAQEHVRLIAQLRSKVYTKEMELQNLKEYSKDGGPQVLRLKNEIDTINQLISELKGGFQEFTGCYLSEDMIPKVSVQYLNLRENITIQQTIYNMLRQEYEKAKIEDTDTTQMFQIQRSWLANSHLLMKS